MSQRQSLAGNLETPNLNHHYFHFLVKLVMDCLHLPHRALGKKEHFLEQLRQGKLGKFIRV